MNANSRLKVLIRVPAKRARDDDTDACADVEANTLPPLVRVRLDTMGPVPALVDRAVGGGAESELVFRRLQAASVAAQVAADDTPLREDSTTTNAEDGAASRPLHVSRFVRGRDYILLDCTDQGHASPSAGSPESHQLYVLEEAVSDGRKREREDADDFSFDDFSFGTGPVDPVLPAQAGPPAKHPTGTLRGAALVPLYYLAPSRRLEGSSSSPFTTTEASVRSPHWQFELGDIQTASALFRAHDVLTVEENVEEVQADLYVYPDHRKDDEYDSNAEDFSGNDYPDDADQGDYDGAADDEHAWTPHPTRAAQDSGYGMYFEDDYVEGDLGPGWQSDDDDDAGY